MSQYLANGRETTNEAKQTREITANKDRWYQLCKETHWEEAIHKHCQQSGLGLFI